MLTPNEQNIALQKASNAMSYIEQMELVIRDLESVRLMVPTEYKGELEALAGRVKALYNMINDDEDVAAVDIISDSNSLSKQLPSKIQRLGITSQIIQLKEVNRLSNKDIAERFGISAQSVAKLLEVYEKAKPTEKNQIKRTSIFDTANQLENLGATIHRCLARLEGQDPQSHVKYVTEMRLLLAQAEKTMNTMTLKEEFERAKDIIVEILATELPEKRALIMQRFSQVGLKAALSVPGLPLK